ncbi:hypothetical protein [Streptomyces roseus]|uniref:hypothetical protein n=1 Tax=Streptomyces roseus TaxID=66430 RepID=UPI000A4CE3B5
MRNDVRKAVESVLYEAAYYQGAGVRVPADGGDEGETAVAYALARLGLTRLGSVQAPTVAAHPENPFRQDVDALTHVTVWAARPAHARLDPAERGTAWQDYTADTEDLGDWGARATYVRVWKHAAEGPPADAGSLSGPSGSLPPLVIVDQGVCGASATAPIPSAGALHRIRKARLFARRATPRSVCPRHSGGEGFFPRADGCDDPLVQVSARVLVGADDGASGHREPFGCAAVLHGHMREAVVFGPRRVDVEFAVQYRPALARAYTAPAGEDPARCP